MFVCCAFFFSLVFLICFDADAVRVLPPPTRPNDTNALACWDNATQELVKIVSFWDHIWGVFWTFTAVYAGIVRIVFFFFFFFFFFIAKFIGVFRRRGAQMLLLVVAAKFILPKDPAFCRLISVASLFCMWLMWACVYLCQVSPLIRPKVRVAE